MTYAQTLDYLFAQLPMYQRIGPAAFKKDLTNTLALCESLGNPHFRFPSIHIGGTNGKGSVSHLLAAVLQASGLRVGLYISPHYRDFRERIKINGRQISRRAVVDFVEKNRPTLEKIEPSFFEMTVGLAFDFFATKKVDIAVVEVGLGGRLDSTNVILPVCSVITNISFDHMAMLGDTLPLIAGEKAGIIKRGVPVVIGEMSDESAPVFLKKAVEMDSPISFADQIFDVKTIANDWKSTTYDIFKNGKLFLKNLELDAAGPFQNKNVATVLQTIEQLNATAPSFFSKIEGGFLTENHVRDGFRNLRRLTRFQGRWQIIGDRPTILCDSAHNEAGLKLVFETISTLDFERLHLVCGFVNDKDLDAALALFPKKARYFFAKADIPRGLAADVLKEKAAEFGLIGRSYSSVKNALAAARRAAAPTDLILVIGSIFVVAEVLPVQKRG